MSGALEQALRELYAADSAGYDTTAARERLNVRTPRPRAQSRVMWSAVGAAAAAALGGVLTAVLILSSGAPVAYAGWSSVPAKVAPSSIPAVSHLCGHAITGTDAAVYARAFSGQPVLSESRGIYTAVIDVSDGTVYSCLTGGSPERDSGSFNLAVTSYGHAGPVPAANLISAPYTLQGGFGEGRGHPGLLQRAFNASPSIRHALLSRFRGGGYGPNLLGRAGSRVTAVRVSFANGRTVAATVENGWYFAWWPWTSSPTSVTVIADSRIVTSPVKGSDVSHALRVAVVPRCHPGSSGCVFAGATPVRSDTTTVP